MSEKEVVTITKLDGSVTKTERVENESLKAMLVRAKEYAPEKYTYMLNGPNIEGGQKQVDDALLDSIQVESMDEVLIIPKTIAG